MVLRGDPDLSADPWPCISGEAKDVVRRLLTVDPVKRATAGEILAHPWLRNAHPRREGRAGGGTESDATDKPFDSAVLQRLRGFAAMNRLKRVALLVVGQSLSPEELRGLKELFRSIDRDNSGSITAQELKEALAAWEHRIPEAELAQLVSVADVDCNGTIDYNEFVAATAHVSRLEREEVLMRAFQALDLDASGGISADELGEALERFGLAKKDAQELLASADANGDGKLDFDEFAALMRQKSTAAALELGAIEGDLGLGGLALAGVAEEEGASGGGRGGPRAHPIVAGGVEDGGAAEGEEDALQGPRRRSASTRAQMSAVL
jgi:calcium-dependent protein kinase